jgi:hypothetical protein
MDCMKICFSTCQGICKKPIPVPTLLEELVA